MGEWALPPDESAVFHEVLEDARAQGRPEARWLRGASWRNFQVKYREVNDLHKQMLRISDAVDAMADGADRTLALDHLYRGQSNDCYWHGLFGGIYISHMRLATYEHLIAAEDLADAAAGRGSTRRSSSISTWTGATTSGWPSAGQVVTIDLDEGAGIGGWDIRAVRHALTAVMRRRPEAYHADAARPRRRRSRSTGAPRWHGRGSIHERVVAKEAGSRRPPPLRPVRAAVGAGPLPRPGDDARRLGGGPRRRAR